MIVRFASVHSQAGAASPFVRSNLSNDGELRLVLSTFPAQLFLITYCVSMDSDEYQEAFKMKTTVNYGQIIRGLAHNRP
ncbi:hypothetical protein [Cohnella herbarum]|uniref:Uncharacterized protein n=1 Tax=Cohnella herbarum TaxID=2728023 RepID=A0A7Z2ZPH0_9BACL|nr:hypothetical protein [Cohnella herbarum]QJD85987.1 hypothetical protein HH215_24295 [Cohnella herbarum]